MVFLDHLAPNFSEISDSHDLKNYVKVYDLLTDDKLESGALDITTIRGTFIKRLIRHKKFQTEEFMPGVLLLSLPINFSFQFNRNLSDFDSNRNKP